MTAKIFQKSEEKKHLKNIAEYKSLHKTKHETKTKLQNLNNYLRHQQNMRCVQLPHSNNCISSPWHQSPFDRGDRLVYHQDLSITFYLSNLGPNISLPTEPSLFEVASFSSDRFFLISTYF